MQQRKLLYMGLYLLIWGEAANLRFMPECLCYIYHHNLINVQEAILRLLDDTELTVVQAALRVDGLPNVMDSSKLLDALLNVLRRCMDKLLSGRNMISYINVHIVGYQDTSKKMVTWKMM